MDFIDVLIDLYVKLLSKYNGMMNNKEKLADFNLSLSHINYLEIIASKESITSSDLAKIMNVTKPAVTSIINTLINKGYVEKVQSDVDKRIFNLSVTDEYRKFRYPGVQITQDFILKAYEAFTDEEIELLKKLLLTLSKIV